MRTVRSSSPLAVLAALLAVVAVSLDAAPAEALTPLPEAELTPAPEHLPQSPTVDTATHVVPLTFPVADPDRGVTFVDGSFLQERGGGTRLHAATDVMAPKHRSVHAAVGGTISWAPSSLPDYGWMISIRGDDGLRYSYVHLNDDTPSRTAAGGWSDDDAGGVEHAYAPRIVEAIRTDGTASGLRVEQGELIGWVGDSGNAKGVGAHLHLEIEVPGPDGPYRIDPTPSLRAALEGGHVVAHVPGPSADSGYVTAQPIDATSDDEAAADDHGYDDVRDDGAHTPAIARLATAGVVTGCEPARYCPHESVTRGDLSAFLAAAKGLATGGTPRFRDVPAGDPNAGAIAAVHDAGLLSGYGGDRFGPGEPLSRAQLATVLVQAFDVPAVAGDAPFDDVPPDGVHSANIAAAHAAGLTDGCGDGGDYCGPDPVTRGQIASFLVDAMDAHG